MLVERGLLSLHSRYPPMKVASGSGHLRAGAGVLRLPFADVYEKFPNQSIDCRYRERGATEGLDGRLRCRRDFSQLCAPSHRHAATVTCNMSS